jgi:hypothetical protein
MLEVRQARQRGVTLAASLPCYSAANVDRQQGSGVFEGALPA